jgi:hypothetical protein
MVNANFMQSLEVISLYINATINSLGDRYQCLAAGEGPLPVDGKTYIIER